MSEICVPVRNSTVQGLPWTADCCTDDLTGWLIPRHPNLSWVAEDNHDKLCRSRHVSALPLIGSSAARSSKTWSCSSAPPYVFRLRRLGTGIHFIRDEAVESRLAAFCVWNYSHCVTETLGITASCVTMNTRTEYSTQSTTTARFKHFELHQTQSQPDEPLYSQQ